MRSFFGLGILAFFALTSISGIAQTDSQFLDQKSLRGLRGISVQVMKPETPMEGVSLQQIQTDVELKLRKSGIRVLPFSSIAQLPRRPFLWISVLALKNPTGISVYSVNVELWQDVSLMTNPPITLSAATYVIPPRLKTVEWRDIRQLLEDISDCIDIFMNDYLAMNPK